MPLIGVFSIARIARREIIGSLALSKSFQKLGGLGLADVLRHLQWRLLPRVANLQRGSTLMQGANDAQRAEGSSTTATT